MLSFQMTLELKMELQYIRFDFDVLEQDNMSRCHERYSGKRCMKIVEFLQN